MIVKANRMLRKRRLRRLLVVAGSCLLGAAAGSIHVGRQLAAPVPRRIGPPPEFLCGRTVAVPSGSGSTLAGWLTEGAGARGSVLLLHGIRADRRSMAARARFLHERGYSTLCVDFQAHGESPGGHITMGHLEAVDAAAGVRYLRALHPGQPVAVVGTSLGGAAALMADYGDPPEALVVEAVFADVETAIGNRLDLQFGRPGRVLTPLLSWQFRPFLGIDVDQLSPLRAAARVNRPVFVLCGSEDRHARPAEARAIHAALGGPKEIWEVAGAAHVDLHRFAGDEYERRVGGFIDRHLRARED